MAEIDDAKLARLLRDLRSDDWKVATQAQHSLVRAGVVAFGPLCELLDADLEVAWRAAWVLGRLKERRAAPVLSRRLIQLLQEQGEHPRSAEDRRALLLAELAEALGVLGEPSGATALCAALSSSHLNVRKQASKALKRMGPAAISELCATLGQLSAEGLIAVAGILEKDGDTRAIAPLCAVLDHPDWVVRHRATMALGALAPRYPVLALRFAIPHLERNQRGWNWIQEPLRAASKRTLGRIEAATAHLQDVPLPSTSPLADLETLPLPAASLSSGQAPPFGPQEDAFDPAHRGDLLFRLLKRLRRGKP